MKDPPAQSILKLATTMEGASIGLCSRMCALQRPDVVDARPAQVDVMNVLRLQSAHSKGCAMLSGCRRRRGRGRCGGGGGGRLCGDL